MNSLPSTRHLLRLELADALVDALRDVVLLALQVGDVARELLDLAAQLGVVGAQRSIWLFRSSRLRCSCVDLLADICAICSAWRARVLLVACSSAGAGRGWRGAPRRRRTAPACAGRRRRTATQRRRRARERAAARETSARMHQRYASSARRFFAHAASSLPCTAGRSLPKLTASSWRRRRRAASATWRTASARLLAEREVVFAAAALVGVALDGDVALAVGASAPCALASIDRLELVLDDVAVEVEVDDAAAAFGRRRVARAGRRRPARPASATRRAGVRAGAGAGAGRRAGCASRPAPASSSLTLEHAAERARRRAAVERGCDGRIVHGDSPLLADESCAAAACGSAPERAPDGLAHVGRPATAGAP